MDVDGYASELLRTVRKHLKKAADKAGEKALHAIRVEVKRIRALMNFLSYTKGQAYEEDEKLTKLFKRAGNIRELQILIKRLKKRLAPAGKEEEMLIERMKK